jgi:hypothetical protein
MEVRDGCAVVFASTCPKAFEEIQTNYNKMDWTRTRGWKLVLVPRAYNGKANGVFSEWIGE